MRRLIILRPEPGASATEDRARKLGLRPEKLPLFRIEPLPWTAPDADRYDGLLVTSASAMRHGGEELAKLTRLPVHAVGQATAEAARARGFRVEATGSAGVEELLSALPDKLRLLHLCGQDRRHPSAPRQEITSVPVYRAAPAGNRELSGKAGNSVILVHSPRAGERLAKLVPEKDRGSVRVVAISAAAAKAAGLGWEALVIAGSPTDDALLALAVELCQNRT